MTARLTRLAVAATFGAPGSETAAPRGAKTERR